MQIYFQFPFLHINNYQIMPSLIVFFIFLGILALLFFLGRLGKEKSNLDINTLSAKQRYRYIWKNTFLFGTAYIMIFLLSYFLKDEKYLGNKANIIVKLANAYLNIELVVVFIMFFAFMYIFLVNKNKKAYFEFLKKSIVVLIYLSAFSYAVTHQIELGYKYNLLGYIFLALVSIFIFSVDILDKVDKYKEQKSNYFQPINGYESLCESHKNKAESLKRIIQRNSNCGGISILVKGDWGIGKTSVVNGAIDILKNHKKIEKNLDDKEADDLINYEILRINALEIDSLESLFNYFFDFIRRCLKERGAYTGIASEYREFVSSALGIVTNESFGNVFTRLFYSENKNYREKKEELEKSIGNVLGKDKIIIVVDDIERCEKEKVKQFIFFIKEIATMNNCITIFISDEKALKECILDDKNNNTKINTNINNTNNDTNINTNTNTNTNTTNNNKYMKDFLDKFFNYTLSVNTIDYRQVLDSLNKTHTYEDYMQCYSNFGKNLWYMRFKKIDNSLKIDEFGFLKLKEVIELTIDSLDEKIKKVQNDISKLSKNDLDKSKKYAKEKELENLKGAKLEFEDSINNPRKLTKLYNSYLNFKKDVSLNFKKFGKEESFEKNKDYLEKINASKLIFSLSYIFEYFPEKADLIEKRGIQIYLNEIQGIYEEENQFLLQELTELNIMKKNNISEYLNKSIYYYEPDYSYKKKEKFIDNLVKNEEITPDTFTNKEQKLLDYVENKEWEKIIKEDVWFDIVKIIIENSIELNLEENKKYSNDIEFILENLKNSIENNDLKSESVLLKIKSPFNRNFFMRLKLSSLCIMKSIYNKFFDKNQTFDKLQEITSDYEIKDFISSKLVKFLGGLLYITDIKNEEEIEDYIKQIIYSNSKYDFEKDIDGFIKIFSNNEKLKYVLENNNLDNFRKLDKLIDMAEEDTKENKLFEYEDVKLNLKNAKDAIEDIEYLLKIIEKLNSSSKEIEINNQNIVSEFLLKFKNNKIDRVDVSDFFKKIEKNKDIVMDKNQIGELNKLITELFTSKIISHTRTYRQSLFWHSERINKSEKI